MNRPEITYNDHMVTVTSAQSNEVAKQMTWIAKGSAGIAHQSSLAKGKIHTLVEATDFYAETNTNLDDNMTASIGFDYDQEVNNWLQTNVAGNDYDQAYFFDINIDACTGKVSIRIPEADTADQTKLHVVTPENVFDDVQTTMGYYITSTGGLDSLAITEDNMDSVYLWVIGLESDCENAGFCGDGILNANETCESCPEDCPRTAHVTQPGSTYKLYLKEIKIFTDNKNGASGWPSSDYQEGHLQNDYNIRMSYGTYNKNNREWNHWEWDETLWNNNVGTARKIKNYDAWGKNAEVKRCNVSKGTCNRGSHTIDTRNELLISDFQPKYENIAFSIFERDYYSTVWNRNDPNILSNSWSYTYKVAQNSGINNLPKVNAGTIIDSWKIIEAGQIDPPGYPWVKVGNNWEYVDNLDGELSVVFKLVKN